MWALKRNLSTGSWPSNTASCYKSTKEIAWALIWIVVNGVKLENYQFNTLQIVNCGAKSLFSSLALFFSKTKNKQTNKQTKALCCLRREQNVHGHLFWRQTQTQKLTKSKTYGEKRTKRVNVSNLIERHFVWRRLAKQTAQTALPGHAALCKTAQQAAATRPNRVGALLDQQYRWRQYAKQ